MLLAADLALPRLVWAHGYVQWEGAKLSKTAGTAVDLGGAIARYGPDALRYFLLREIGFENDGNFTWERYDARYTSELADTFGNLVSRTLSLVLRHRGGGVPHDPLGGGHPTPLEEAGRQALRDYATAMDAFALADGAALIMELASRANRYVEETAPWTLAKSGKDAELDSALANLVRTVARLAVLAAPFIPGKAEVIWNLLGTGRTLADVRLADLAEPPVEGRTVTKPPILFPKPPAT
jgi:methionyl-tRNA synthetase